VLSSVTLAANWGIFIWAVNDNRILEVSLGYFIIPLVSILFGTVVFKERLNKAQWLAIAIAATGLCSELVVLGYMPFVSLCLAFSFGAYSLLKKLSTVEPLVGFTVEMLFLMPFFLAWLIWRQYSGDAHFPYEAWITLLLVGTGVITAMPLVMFAWGIKRSAMTTVGLVQYTSPALMFLTGTLIYNEPVSSVRLLSFILTWTSIIIFTVESLWRVKKSNGPITH
jgi:chloramphenicol-sensitive protein RarD